MPMGAGDFRRIEAVWGLPLPEAYKRFLSAYGPVEFPDDFSAFDYTRNAPDGGRSILQGAIACMASVEALEIAHRHLIATPTTRRKSRSFRPTCCVSPGAPEPISYCWSLAPQRRASGSGKTATMLSARTTIANSDLSLTRSTISSTLFAPLITPAPSQRKRGRLRSARRKRLPRSMASRRWQEYPCLPPTGLFSRPGANLRSVRPSGQLGQHPMPPRDKPKTSKIPPKHDCLSRILLDERRP